MAQKSVLGKGLASLLPAAATAAHFSGATTEKTSAGTPPGAISPSRDRHMGISFAAVDEIQTNPFQPRRDFDEGALVELVQSIRTSGIIQPIIVRKNAQNGLELIAGERRLRAARLAGLKQIPIVIRKSTDRESLELALIENIQRQNLNCVDEALAYFQLIEDFSLTQEEVADRVGKDRATVANYLRLLRLPEIILADLKKQVLSFGHGKALLSLDPETRLKVRNQIIEQRWSVRETEKQVEKIRKRSEEPLTPGKVVPLVDAVTQRLSHLSRELSRYWSTQIEVKGGEDHGKIVIHYASRQDLERVIEKMRGEL